MAPAGDRRCSNVALLLCGCLVLGAGAVAPGLYAAEDPRPPSPSRTFDTETRLFVSQATPALQLSVPKELRYLGRLEFPLKEKAWVDRHLFARLSGQEIERLVVLQFEGLLEGIEGSYRFGIPGGDSIAGSNYRFSPERIQLGGHGWVHNTWAFDHQASAAEGPGLESDRTVRYLEGQGLKLDAELIMSRFVRAVGSKARDELILFYMVPLATTGHSLDEFPDGGASSEAYDRLSERVTRESLELFQRLGE